MNRILDKYLAQIVICEREPEPQDDTETDWKDRPLGLLTQEDGRGPEEDQG